MKGKTMKSAILTFLLVLLGLCNTISANPSAPAKEATQNSFDFFQGGNVLTVVPSNQPQPQQAENQEEIWKSLFGNFGEEKENRRRGRPRRPIIEFVENMDDFDKKNQGRGGEHPGFFSSNSPGEFHSEMKNMFRNFERGPFWPPGGSGSSSGGAPRYNENENRGPPRGGGGGGGRFPPAFGGSFGPRPRGPRRGPRARSFMDFLAAPISSLTNFPRRSRGSPPPPPPRMRHSPQNIIPHHHDHNQNKNLHNTKNNPHENGDGPVHNIEGGHEWAEEPVQNTNHKKY